MSDWMKDFKENQDKDKENINDATKKILDAIKGLDRVSCIPTILANLFEGIENETGKDEIHGFRNQMVNWGIETYTARKLTKVIPNLLALHSYCKDKEYTEDNTWEWGSGDRTVCYIPNDSKDILLFENQNIQFVVVFDKLYIHVREVFKSLINDNDQYFEYKDQSFDSVDELREALKTPKGLEIALCNLTGSYTRFANPVDGNFYPNRIDLNNMKQHNFGKKSPAFTYGDNRDKGYLMSMCTIFSDKCEINDINRSGYAFDDMTGATMRIPKKYIKAIKRDNKLNELLD
jgi:hypothetical protein